MQPSNPPDQVPAPPSFPELPPLSGETVSADAPKGSHRGRFIGIGVGVLAVVIASVSIVMATHRTDPSGCTKPALLCGGVQAEDYLRQLAATVKPVPPTQIGVIGTVVGISNQRWTVQEATVSFTPGKADTYLFKKSLALGSPGTKLTVIISAKTTFPGTTASRVHKGMSVIALGVRSGNSLLADAVLTTLTASPVATSGAKGEQGTAGNAVLLGSSSGKQQGAEGGVSAGSGLGAPGGGVSRANSVDPTVAFAKDAGLPPWEFQRTLGSVTLPGCGSQLKVEIQAGGGLGYQYNFPFEVTGTPASPLQVGHSGAVDIHIAPSETGTSFVAEIGVGGTLSLSADVCGHGNYEIASAEIGMKIGAKTSEPPFPSSAKVEVESLEPCPSMGLSLEGVEWPGIQFSKGYSNLADISLCGSAELTGANVSADSYAVGGVGFAGPVVQATVAANGDEHLTGTPTATTLSLTVENFRFPFDVSLGLNLSESFLGHSAMSLNIPLPNAVNALLDSADAGQHPSPPAVILDFPVGETVASTPTPVVYDWLHFSCGNSTNCEKRIGYSYGFDPKDNQAMSPAQCESMIAAGVLGLPAWNGTLGTWCNSSTAVTQDPAGIPIATPKPQVVHTCPSGYPYYDAADNKCYNQPIPSGGGLPGTYRIQECSLGSGQLGMTDFSWGGKNWACKAGPSFTTLATDKIGILKASGIWSCQAGTTCTDSYSGSTSGTFYDYQTGTTCDPGSPCSEGWLLFIVTKSG
jgi:hypothetical protein